MKNDRLKFARQHAHWGVKEWKKVMFNDESHFSQIWEPELLLQEGQGHRPI
jgi:hypothetical protein